MTNQEIFDKVVAHLRKQNARSIEGNMCMYRSLNGLKCAVGCLIKDDAYSIDLEGKSVIYIAVRSALLTSGVHDSTPTIDMLWCLQNMHDTVDPAEWESNFARIANDYNLTYSQP